MAWKGALFCVPVPHQGWTWLFMTEAEDILKKISNTGGYGRVVRRTGGELYCGGDRNAAIVCNDVSSFTLNISILFMSQSNYNFLARCRRHSTLAYDGSYGSGHYEPLYFPIPGPTKGDWRTNIRHWWYQCHSDRKSLQLVGALNHNTSSISLATSHSVLHGM